ncbi:hypothetical protein Pmani_016497 [Petrolisthes manimaculis]|uniref:Uncharacterized protein n=1 Tax=Petrolisthes manimaculis TaxID=1843537 RepID=A0AAE1PP06_9EUCA|nr:hypothetical protein Pmani_016497 [Petrolisthes manimaculis]
MDLQGRLEDPSKCTGNGCIIIKTTQTVTSPPCDNKTQIARKSPAEELKSILEKKKQAKRKPGDENPCVISIPRGGQHKPVLSVVSQEDLRRLKREDGTFTKVKKNKKGHDFLVQCAGKDKKTTFWMKWLKRHL